MKKIDKHIKNKVKHIVNKALESNSSAIQMELFHQFNHNLDDMEKALRLFETLNADRTDQIKALRAKLEGLDDKLAHLAQQNLGSGRQQWGQLNQKLDDMGQALEQLGKLSLEGEAG